MFELHTAFKDKVFITDLKLSKVLLNNTVIPWIFLIPRRENVKQINQLSLEDSTQLMMEINLCSNIMEKLFQTDRINVAAIGNKTEQLHVHVISRQKIDEVWPETVWGLQLEKLNSEKLADRAQDFVLAFRSNSFLGIL